jgi:anhydro-N-acetylmuramic acid kinase
MKADLYIGLMSGTSMDGIDAVIAAVDDRSCRVLHHHKHAYSVDLQRRLRAAVAEPHAGGLDSFGVLHTLVAREFAASAQALLTRSGIDPARIAAIGSHGQTIVHAPDAAVPYTIQLGDPATIAAITRITVVGDFRHGDIALGGQGAPLTPAFHASVFGDATANRAVVNIGGIANVTLLPARGPVSGFDTGPGNTLLDAWCQVNLAQPFDDGGRWSAGGKVHAGLLAHMRSDGFFSRRPPKSTGLDYFNIAWLRRCLRDAGDRLAPQDVQATLAELTAAEIARGIASLDAISIAAVCGGGSRNGDLLSRLKRCLPGCQVLTTDAWGIAADQVEAAAFAWLARERLRGTPTNLPGVTGARKRLSLGGVYLPPV